MDTSQLDALIVEHLADLDAAANQVIRIEERIWKAMGDLMKEHSEENGWRGSFDKDDDVLWLAPPEWVIEGEEIAWFTLDLGPADQDNRESDLYFDLSRLCGLGEGSLSFWFRLNAGKRQWKPVAKALAENVADLGFSMTDSATFHMDCTPSQSAMAQALSDDDFEQALKPLSLALDRLPASVPAFTTMLQQSKLL